MATLFERLAGVQADGFPPAEGKIPLHIFTSLMREYKDGRISGPEAKALMGLTTENVQDVQWIFQALSETPNKGEFLRAMKDRLYLAEWKGTRDAYAVENEFWTRLSDEVTEQGGTPPAR